jgi:hypothetical protein
MSSSTEKALITKLNNLIAKGEKQKIIDWLEMLKKFNVTDGKIPHIFGNSKIQIETVSESGTYNVILVWLKNNAQYFKSDDFVNIPDSNHTKASDIIKGKNDSPAASGPVEPKTFITTEDVARWKENPTIHPINNAPMNPVSEMYYQIYKKAYKILTKNNIKSYDMEDLLPDNHVLFGNIDLLFYHQSNKSFNETEKICELLSDNNDFTEHNVNSILETEIELLKNRFNNVYMDVRIRGRISRISNLQQMKDYFKEHNENMINKLLSQMFNYNTTEIYDIIYHSGNQNISHFIIFIENNKLDNNMKIIDYIKQNLENITWKKECLKLYDSYKKIYTDIANLLDRNSGIVENHENITFNNIPDPIDKYFKTFEEDLEVIKDPMFSRFIDLTTFKPSNIEESLKYRPNNTSMYLNNKDYAKFLKDNEKAKEEYDKNKENYNKLYKKYEKDKRTDATQKSPDFPVKPSFLLGNGTPYTYGHQEPINIKDDVVNKFNKEYNSVKKTIDKYNEIKNMTYDKLVKEGTNKSPSSSSKAKMKENELFKMTREEIKNKVLYKDHSGSSGSHSDSLKNRCNQKIDILTKDEFDDENYPLAKLQLMVRLEMNKKTECIYAPALYNYLVDCVNSKKLFVNPITNQKYTQKHINQLMDTMRIVDPNIIEPKYFKQINDTKLRISITQKPPIDIERYKGYDGFTGWDSISQISFYEINIMRQFGDTDYCIFNLCTIPADMDTGGVFATGSADLTSAVMLSKITTLFENGRLLCNYLPPYYTVVTDDYNNQYIRYIDLVIHFNRYKNKTNWYFDKATNKYLSKEEFIKLFKHYAEEINNFI